MVTAFAEEQESSETGEKQEDRVMHTTRIILLDREGTQLAGTELVGRVDAAFVEAIKNSLQ